MIGRKISGRPMPSSMRELAKYQKPTSPYTLVMSYMESATIDGAGDDQIFRLDLGRQAADHEHHHHGHEAARRQHEAGPGRGVAEILLHELRQELGGREQDGAGRQHHQEAGAELARRHHPDVDHRIAAADLPRDHQHEGERADRCERRR